MKSVKTTSLLYVMGCALFLGSTAAQANTFSGRAFGAQVKLLGIDLTLVDTGYLPPTVGSLSKSLAEIDLDLDLLGSIVDAELLEAKTSGKYSTAKSSAELANLDIELLDIEVPLLGGLLGSVLELLDLEVDASVVKANSKAYCSYGYPKVSGSSTFSELEADLTVLGVEIEADGTKNQTIDVLGLGLVKVVLNEQKKSWVGNMRVITVNAVHVTVGLPIFGPVADVIVASAKSGIACEKPISS